MTYYKVGLWPGKGYYLDVVIVEASSDYGALAKAASMGYGDTMTMSEYDSYLKSNGIDPKNPGDFEDEDYSWFDEDGWQGFINLRHAYAKEVTGAEEQIGKLGFQPYFFGGGMNVAEYIRAPDGREVGVCENCGKVSLEEEGGACPFCHQHEMRALNISYKSDADLFMKYKPSGKASMDRKGGLFKGKGKRLQMKPLIKLRRK